MDYLEGSASCRRPTYQLLKAPWRVRGESVESLWGILGKSPGGLWRACGESVGGRWAGRKVRFSCRLCVTRTRKWSSCLGSGGQKADLTEPGEGFVRIPVRGWGGTDLWGLGRPGTARHGQARIHVI